MTPDSRERLTRNYRTAFLRYLPRREEAALHSAYEIGRSAFSDGVSLLDLTLVHHQVLLEVLQDSRGDDLADIATAAAQFLLDALATYDMTQRRLRDQGS